MPPSSQTIDLPVVLHISLQTKETLTQRAAASATDLAGYISILAEQTVQPPLSLAEISGPVFQRFLNSGTTDDELSQELERAKHELRTERRARQSP